MLFKDWLKQFSGQDVWDDEDVITVWTVLNTKYETLRHVKYGDEYPLTDCRKARINSDSDSVRQFAKRCFSRIRAPYKSVRLLKNSDTLPDDSTNGWFYREYVGNKPKKARSLNSRLSLNVYMAPQLILYLDEILDADQGEHILEYKTPASASHWQERHDPITIYFSDLTPELLHQIVNAAKPFLRPEKSSEIVGVKNPFGIELPKGIYYNEEYSKSAVKKFLDSFNVYFPSFYEDVIKAFDRNGKHNLSTGQLYILKKFQHQLSQDINKIDKKSIDDYLAERRNDKLLGFRAGLIELKDKHKTEADFIALLNKQAQEDKQKLDAFVKRFSKGY